MHADAEAFEQFNEPEMLANRVFEERPIGVMEGLPLTVDRRLADERLLRSLEERAAQGSELSTAHGNSTRWHLAIGHRPAYSDRSQGSTPLLDPRGQQWFR